MQIALNISGAGIILANIALDVPSWRTLPEPPGIKPGRYFLYVAL